MNPVDASLLTQTKTCDRCGASVPELTARETWRCISPGILGSADFYWLCPQCYTALYGSSKPANKDTV